MKYTVVPVELRLQEELIGPEWFGRQPAMVATAPKCYNRNGDLCLPQKESQRQSTFRMNSIRTFQYSMRQSTATMK